MTRNLAWNGLLGLLACTATTVALAQYAWIDGQGVHQYSDQPPPASVPKARILQQPATALRNTPSEPRTAAPAAIATTPEGIATDPPVIAAPVAAKAAPTTADKNADYLKRQAALAEKEKKQVEGAQQAVAKARQCEQAQAYARSLQSGERIAVTDKNGERGYLSDEKRALELVEARRVQDACK